MSKKHNTVHDRRGPSHYKERLADRSVTNAAVRMPFIDDVGHRHETPDFITKPSRTVRRTGRR